MIYVIDDFYDNVNEVINLANTLTYRNDVSGEHFLRTYGLPCRNVGERIEKILIIILYIFSFFVLYGLK